MNPKLKSTIREYAESLLIAFILAMLIRGFIVQAFKIPTGSMNPTLIEGDRILVNKFIYRFQPPQRGDVIVFKSPENPKIAFIKRLIAFGEETVMIEDGRIFVGNRPVGDERIGSRIYYNLGLYGDYRQKITVPEKHFYVLGDNSANSRDSRYWGFVPGKFLIGKAMLVYWPLQRIRIIR